MTDRKHPTAAFWITVALVAVLVGTIGYPLSHGPAVWLFYQVGEPNWMSEAIDVIYAPLEWGCDNSPDWLRDLYGDYDLWWFPR